MSKRRKNPLTDVVYHKVSLSTAVAIVESNKLMTSPAYGTSSDAGINKGYLYFVSFMRSPQSGYRRGQSSHAILIQLDGRKLNERYAGGPVDYWGPMYRKGDPGIYEMEDRLFTDKEWIPNVKNYITAFHVAMVEPMGFDVLTDQVAELELLEQKAKKWKIPFYIYTKKSSWKALRSPRHRTVSGWLNACSKEIKEPSPYRSSRGMIYEKDFKGFVATLQAVLAYRKGDTKAFEKLKKGPHKEFFYTFRGYQRDQASKLSSLIHNHKNAPQARPYFAEIRKGMLALKKRTPETLVKEMHKSVNEDANIREKKRSQDWDASERLALQLILAQKSAEKAWEQVAKRKKKGIKILVEPDSRRPVPLQMVEDNLSSYRKRVKEYGGYESWLEKSRGYIEYLPDHVKDLFVVAHANPKRRKNPNPTKSQVIDWFDRWKAIQWEPWHQQQGMIDEKHALIQSLITTAQKKGWPFGFGYDRFSRYSGVLYVDTPVGQVSFHTSVTPNTNKEACKELEKLAYALSRKGKLREVGIRGLGNVLCWDAMSFQFKGGPFANYRGKWDESRETPDRIAQLVAKGIIPWTFDIPPSTNSKQRKNPKFKVGDKIREGTRKGRVQAIHSKGTVDVMFDDMDYPIRRQLHQVRDNPKLRVETYNPDLAQYHAQVEGIYRTLVQKATRSSKTPFIDSRGKRLDVKKNLSKTKMRQLLDQAFTMALALGRREGMLMKSGVKPTVAGKKKAKARLEDHAKWWANVLEYEKTLSLARQDPCRVLIIKEGRKNHYYVMPTGTEYPTRKAAVEEAERLNAAPKRKPRTPTKRRQPTPNKYVVEVSKKGRGGFRRIDTFTRKREAIRLAKKEVNEGRATASRIKAVYNYGRALLVDIATGEITDQRA